MIQEEPEDEEEDDGLAEAIAELGGGDVDPAALRAALASASAMPAAYGCDEEEMERRGEEIAEGETDADDLESGVRGGEGLEVCGDGIDNDGDNEIDECDAGCRDGQTVVTVSDTGQEADDIFLITLDNGASGVTPRGASTSITTNLSPGTHWVKILVVDDGDDVGTYTLIVTVDGADALIASDAPVAGTETTYTFEVDGEPGPLPAPAVVWAPAGSMMEN